MRRVMTKPILLFVAMLVFFILSGCAGNENAAPDFISDERSAGEGSTGFILDVTDDKGTIIRWHVNTDESTVAAALLKEDLISGDESAFGLMITHVNGQRADYTLDGAYWAFYIDGEFAATGADAAQIEQGKVYAFVYTPA